MSFLNRFFNRKVTYKKDKQSFNSDAMSIEMTTFAPQLPILEKKMSLQEACDAIKLNKVDTVTEFFTKFMKSDDSGFRLAQCAIQNHKLDMLKLLLKLGVSPNAEGTLFSRSLLHIAAEAGDAEMITLLLDHQAEIDPRDILNENPLYAAVKADKIDAVKLLLKRGANVGVRSEEYLTSADVQIISPSALHRAVFKRQKEIVSLLIDYGANLLAEARLENKEDKKHKKGKKHKKDKDNKDKKELFVTPLQFAISSNYGAIVELIQEKQEQRVQAKNTLNNENNNDNNNLSSSSPSLFRFNK